MRKDLILVLTLCIAAFFLFTFRITEVPPGINGDEASVGVNAAMISKTGNDSEGRFMPLFTKTKNNPDWKHPVTLYSSVLVFKIFGISYFNLKVVSVIFALISALILYFCVRELTDKKIALFAVILLITTPIIMIQSHLAHDNIAPLPFVSFWLLMLIRYTKTQDSRLLFFAGLSLGVSIITYFGLRLVAPVLAILTIFYIYFLHFKKGNLYINHIKWFILGIIPFGALLLAGRFYYPGSVLGLYRPYGIESYQNLILPYISVFDPSFLFIQGDSTPYHSTGKHGMFLLASLPLFVIGLIKIIRSKGMLLSFILISFFLVPVLFGLGSTVHRASRLLTMVPFYIVIASIGFWVISTIRQKLLRFGLLTIVLMLIGLNFYDFVSDYWYEYPQRVRAEFAKPIHTTFASLATTTKSSNLKPYVEYYLFKSYPDAENFFQQVYFPNGLSDWYREKEVPAQSAVLTDLNQYSTKEKVDIIRVGELDYYFLIRR